MPKHFDRATREKVWQYGNEVAGRYSDGAPVERAEGGDLSRQDCAPKALNTLERLLDECVTAEANTFKGRTAIVTVGRIRQLIGEGLSAEEG